MLLGCQEEIQKRCTNILTKLIKHEHAWPFLDPVDDASAPGYSEVVSTPMDLGTIKKKLKSYGTAHDQFASDVRLVWSNCKAFNEDESEFTSMADTLSELFEKWYTEDFSDPPPKATQKAGKKKSTGGTAKKSKSEAASSQFTKKEIQKRCTNILTKLLNHEHAWPFLDPVDDASAPGYSEVVSTPMDLGTIKKKLKSYGTAHDQFASDVRLVWSNCKAFNEDESEFTSMADTLSELFEKWYTEEFPANAASDAKGKSQKAKSKAKGKGKDDPSMVTGFDLYLISASKGQKKKKTEEVLLKEAKEKWKKLSAKQRKSWEKKAEAENTKRESATASDAAGASADTAEASSSC